VSKIINSAFCAKQRKIAHYALNIRTHDARTLYAVLHNAPHVSSAHTRARERLQDLDVFIMLRGPGRMYIYIFIKNAIKHNAGGLRVRLIRTV
jgi:3-methyladenine DNA glycosylase Mpg